MFFLVIHGRRVETTRLFGCRLFCGACVEVTPHDVMRSSEPSQVYFVDVGPADQTELTSCTACGHVAGCNASLLSADGPIAGARRSDLDAFLRAHASTLALDLRWSPKRIAVASGLVVLDALFSAGVAWTFGAGPAGIGLFVGLVPVVLFAYYGVTQSDLDQHIARELAPKIERLLKRTPLPVRAFAPRARQLGYPRLARFLASPAFEALGKTTTPYR